MVDFERFYSLNPSEARSLLDGFLETEASAAEQMLAEARRQGRSADFSIESLSPLMRWALAQLRTVPLLPDASLPTWITETESYKRGLFDFDDSSKLIVLRIAYYIGECFVRNFPGLTWSVGNTETVEKNMPVVSGFDGGVEMATMLIAENLFRRVLSGDAKDDAIDVAVQGWVALASQRTHHERCH